MLRLADGIAGIDARLIGWHLLPRMLTGFGGGAASFINKIAASHLAASGHLLENTEIGSFIHKIDSCF